jgi:hypothetical protein
MASGRNVDRKMSEVKENILHICYNYLASFFGEALADCFSKARAASRDNGNLALEAVTEDFGFGSHIVDFACGKMFQRL